MDSVPTTTEQAIMNKFLAVFCLAAVKASPEAEADPALLYNAYGYGLGAYNYGAYGLGAYGYAGDPYAAAYAAPAVTGYSQVSPSASLTTAGLGLANAAIPAIAGGYAGAGRYVANSAGVVHVAKRSAEAEADADPALFYSTYGYGLPSYAGYHGLAYNGARLAGYPYTYGAYPYNYGLGYSHYAAAPAVAAAVAAPAVAAPVVAAPVATGYSQVSPSASLTTVGLADASIPAVAGGYAGAGRYA